MESFRGQCPLHSIFRFWFWRRSYKNMKIIRNLCLHFATQEGQDGKNGTHCKENHTTKVTKLPETKRRKYEMNEA